MGDVAKDEVTRLAAQDPVKSELVKLRHFGGLTVDQAAQALGISPTTANRYWAFARAWLHQEITGREAATAGRQTKPEIHPDSVE